MSKRTEIAELGQFGLIDRLTEGMERMNSTTIVGVGDDAAVIDAGDRYMLLSTELFIEGVHFDLTYFPLKHLGYKVVVAAMSDIIAMNGTPKQLTLSLGVSARFSVEHLEELYEGVKAACKEYSIDLVGGDTTASINGLSIGVTAVGEVAKERLVRRSGAKENDLVCITSDLGAAYMGLHLLERERIALDGHPNPEPDFAGHEYILRRWLKPDLRLDIIKALEAEGIIPTAMIDITDGLASDALQLCKASGCGVRLYLERIPIAAETRAMAEELNADPIVAMLNGGDDYELMFTVPLELRDKVLHFGGVDVIGHVTTHGAVLVTPEGGELPITAPGFAATKRD
jgi:thiamine-monophosphate kinase